MQMINQVKSIIEMFQVVIISFEVPDMLPQREKTKTIFIVEYVLNFEKMKEQHHSRLIPLYPH